MSRSRGLQQGAEWTSGREGACIANPQHFTSHTPDQKLQRLVDMLEFREIVRKARAAEGPPRPITETPPADRQRP